MNRIAMWTGVTAVLLVVAGCGEQSGSITSRVQHLERTPTTVKVDRRDVIGYELVPGELYVPPNAEASVKAPYDAPVAQVMVNVGERVGKGQTLVKMSLPDQQQYLAQAEATLKAAEAAYTSAQAQYGGPVRDAQRQLDQARSTERTLRQQAQQTGDGTDLQQAVEARQSAEEALLRARADANANELPYKQQLDDARRAYNLAKAGVRQAQVTAPITGTVLDLRAQTGQPATAGSQLAYIANLGAIQVKADLTSEEATLVKEGKSVVVTFVGLEDKPFDGTVSDVTTLPASNSTVKLQATIDFKNDDGLVKPGMKVKSVGVKVGVAKDVLAVPAEAVFNDQTGKSCVRVLENGEWVVRVVETGLSDGFFTQVKDGLKEGDQVRVPGKM